ncbi:MAG: nitroreductase [Burkholderiaceae bacterium]
MLDTMNEDGLQFLLGRYSLGIKHLVEPGPSDSQLDTMVRAALRAPDHGGLVPFRFSVVRGDARSAFADLLERAAQGAGKAPAATLLDRERAMRAPVTVAVIARIDPGHPLAPGHEQWMAVGGAVANFLTAAHALGFGGKMLSGAKVRLPEVIAAFCEPGEALVGWIGLGTPQRPPAAKHEKPAPDQVMQTWTAR